MTTNGNSPAGRLRALEILWQADGRCQRCHGYPRRFVYQDSETGEQWEETMPADGCPDCGEPIAFTRVYVLDQDPDEP
jgi:hypothetical protein